MDKTSRNRAPAAAEDADNIQMGASKCCNVQLPIFHHDSVAGTQRYNVGIDTPRSFATFRGGTPSRNNRFAAAILESVILRLRPPVRPCRRAASRPAWVLSTVRSRSICARLAITWKKKRPDVVEVSIWSVRHLKCTPRCSRSQTMATRSFRLRPSLSSFHTTRLSFSRRTSRANVRPSRDAWAPLALSS